MSETERVEPVPGQEAKVDGSSLHSEELSLTKFAKLLPTLLAIEFHSKFIFAERGIFLSEEGFPVLIEAYKKWYSTVTERELSDEKAKKRLFGEHTPELHYLINGKSCVVGYLVPCKGVNTIRCSIQSCVGSIDSTVTTLHHRDPIWHEIEGLNLVVGDAGIKCTLSVGEGLLTLRREAIEKFCLIYSRARWMRRLSPSPVQNRREGLRVLVKFLRRARPRGRKLGILIPAKYRDRSVAFIGIASFVLVIQRNSDGTAEFIDCYDLRPPAFGDFIVQEIQEIVRSLNKPRHGNLEIRSDSKGRVAISLHVQHERFELDPHSVGPVLSECQKDPRTAPKLFTLLDLLRSVSRLFERSVWIPPDRVPKTMSAHAARYPRIRTANGWLFFLDRSNTVRRCIRESRTETAPLLLAPRDPQSPRSQRPSRNRTRTRRPPHRARPNR